MRPIMIGHTSIILFNCQSETYQTVLIKTMQTEQIRKHEYGILCFQKIIKSEWIEMIIIDINNTIWYSTL